MRFIAIVASIAVSLAVSAPSAAQSDDRYFVRKESNLRAAPSAAGPVQGLVRPGKILTVLDDTPHQGYARVRTADGTEGWVRAENIRAVALLDADRTLEEFGAPQALGEAAGTATLTMAASGPCKSFAQCPASGCAQPASAHGLSNRRKRAIPNRTHPPTVLSFVDFEHLQEETDHRNIPQGEVLSPSDRSRLKNLDIGHVRLSEGDYVALVGFIAADRTISCGSKESVNCRNGNSAQGPCTKTDIHVPVVPAADDEQVSSVVVEPIPQFGKASVWTPAAFTAAKDGSKKLLVRGGLYYDSQHIVNTGDGPSGQPKRFTLWEVHPVTDVLVCDPDAGTCDPADAAAWTSLGSE